MELVPARDQVWTTSVMYFWPSCLMYTGCLEEEGQVMSVGSFLDRVQMNVWEGCANFLWRRAAAETVTLLMALVCPLQYR